MAPNHLTDLLREALVKLTGGPADGLPTAFLRERCGFARPTRNSLRDQCDLWTLDSVSLPGASPPQCPESHFLAVSRYIS